MNYATDLDTTCINTIQTLATDAVQAANSGHPGTPMALAPVAYCLWQHFLRFDPQDPIWPNRDRFVLSAGHASMLLYSMLHLTGVKAFSKQYETLGEPSVPLEAIKHFRQLGSRCPGHPEYRWTSGVETTTGPLGQGLANSVGMALAGRDLSLRSRDIVLRPRHGLQLAADGGGERHGCGNDSWHAVGHRQTPHPGPPPQGGREPEKPSPLVGEGWVGGGEKPWGAGCQNRLPHPLRWVALR